MRDAGHADRYKNLEVKFIDHHNPDLVLLDKDGSETHRVDLTRLSSTHSIHKLCQLLGLQEVCRDEHSECGAWAEKGECVRNEQYMSVSCRQSCQLCGAVEAAEQDAEDGCRDFNKEECPYWATMGECESNPSFMEEQCRKACGLCSTNKDEL